MTTEERLARVEKELKETRAGLIATKRRNRLTLFALVLVSVGIGLTLGLMKPTVIPQAQAADTGLKTVCANEFRLEDSDGVVRAVLGMGEHGPALFLGDFLGDPEGTIRMMLGFSRLGPMLSLSATDGTPRIATGIMGTDPTLVLYGDDGSNRVALSVLADAARIMMFDPKAELIWYAP